MAATSVSWETLRELAGFRSRTRCAVSCYVDLDPHDTPTPSDARVRMHALIDEARKRAEANRRERTHDQLLSIRGDLQRIEHYFDGELVRDGIHGVAVFAAAGAAFWRPLPLPSSVPDTVKVVADQVDAAVRGGLDGRPPAGACPCVPSERVVPPCDHFGLSPGCPPLEHGPDGM